MDCVGRIVFMFTIVAIVIFYLWPAGNSSVTRDINIDHALGSAIEKKKPQVILFGNSILNEAIDANEFSKTARVTAMKVLNPGANSAWHYVVFKNVISKCSHKPKFVITFFRDHFLTDPKFRTRGKYKENIDKFAGENEPLLDKLAYGDGLNVRFLQEKDKSKTFVENFVKSNTVSLLFGLRSGEVQGFIDRMFDEKHMDAVQLNKRQLEVESSDRDTNYDFTSAVRESFLPEMIKIAKDSDIKLVYVRMKRRPSDDGEIHESNELKKYIEDLKKYLGDNDIPLIDFSYNKNLSIEFYGAGDHLNRDEGRKFFLPLLIEAFQPYL